MELVIKIIIILVLAIILWVFIKRRFINTFIIKKYFEELSITVCGKRGRGKDTLFSYVAFNKKHNSNIPLQKHTNIIGLHELMIPDLDREKLVQNQFESIDKSNYSKFENITFISDASIYFPSYDDSKLKKDYDSLAISIAIWRHLYNAPIHFNTQNFERLWKILREQVEDTILCLDCKRGRIYTKLKLRYYESPRDCMNQLKPIKHKLFKRESDVLIEESQRFEIKDYTLLIPNRYINHDTRYFEKIVFKNNKLRSEQE